MKDVPVLNKFSIFKLKLWHWWNFILHRDRFLLIPLVDVRLLDDKGKVIETLKMNKFNKDTIVELKSDDGEFLWKGKYPQLLNVCFDMIAKKDENLKGWEYILKKLI